LIIYLLRQRIVIAAFAQLIIVLAGTFLKGRWGTHGRRQRGAGGPWPPWIFIHGTNI